MTPAVAVRVADTLLRRCTADPDLRLAARFASRGLGHAVLLQAAAELSPPPSLALLAWLARDGWPDVPDSTTHRLDP